MIQAAIFDMDGLLIDSEPYWKEAERQVFGPLGAAVTSEATELTPRRLSILTGRPAARPENPIARV